MVTAVSLRVGGRREGEKEGEEGKREGRTGCGVAEKEAEEMQEEGKLERTECVNNYGKTSIRERKAGLERVKIRKYVDKRPEKMEKKKKTHKQLK